MRFCQKHTHPFVFLLVFESASGKMERVTSLGSCLSTCSKYDFVVSYQVDVPSVRRYRAEKLFRSFSLGELLCLK